jgi:DNA-binding MarR family transcriptional regulator
MVLGHLVWRVVERRLALHGQNRSQAGILLALRHHSGMRVQDLASRMLIEPSSATRAAQALEGRGLVVRRAHPADGRASLLELTDEGRAAAEQIEALLREVSDDLLSEVGPADRDRLPEIVAALFARTRELKGLES